MYNIQTFMFCPEIKKNNDKWSKKTKLMNNTK